MTHKSSFISRVAAWALLVCLSTPVLANNQVDDLISALANAKAQLEGRAARVQNCAGLRSSKIIEDLRSKYDDARNSYNSRLDGWVFVLRNQPSKTLEGTLEVNRLADARLQASIFLEAADRELKKSACTTKIFWKDVAVVVAPLILEPIFDRAVAILRGSPNDEKSRMELINFIEKQKIDDWRGIKTYVIYDWDTKSVITTKEIDSNLLRKASTTIYVNGWALSSNPGSLVVKDKLPPEELPDDYRMFTGNLKDLKRYLIKSQTNEEPLK